MNGETEQLLKNLHLARIAEILDEELSAAKKNDLPYGEFFVRLLRAEWHHKQECALA